MDLAFGNVADEPFARAVPERRIVVIGKQLDAAAITPSLGLAGGGGHVA